MDPPLTLAVADEPTPTSTLPLPPAVLAPDWMEMVPVPIGAAPERTLTPPDTRSAQAGACQRYSPGALSPDPALRVQSAANSGCGIASVDRHAATHGTRTAAATDDHASTGTSLHVTTFDRDLAAGALCATSRGHAHVAAAVRRRTAADGHAPRRTKSVGP